MPVFDDDFLEELPDDPKVALHTICVRFPKFRRQNTNPGLESHLEAYALIRAYAEAHIAELFIEIPPLPKEDTKEKIDRIFNLATDIQKSLHSHVRKGTEDQLLKSYQLRFAKQLRGAFHYVFTDGDLERIQTLLNELRDVVTHASAIDEKYRRRLLMRLERLQSELHKKMGDIDRFLGLVGDAGVAIGKFGKDAKPFVDRVREILKIVWRTQARAEELPTDAKPALDFSNSEDA